MRLGVLVLVLAGVSVAAWLLLDGAGSGADDGATSTHELLTDEVGPALSTKGTSKDAPPRALDGAAVAGELETLEGKGLWLRLQELASQADRVTVGYDEALVARLLALLGHEDNRVAYGARRLLTILGPEAKDAVLPLLSHGEVGMRMHGIGIVGAWGKDGFVLPAERWLTLFRDEWAQVNRYAWGVVVGGVPYDEALADYLQSVMRAAPTASYNSAARGIVRMGPQGIERMFAMLEKPNSPFVGNVLSALRSARPQDLRPYLDRLEPWMRSEDEDAQVLALQTLHMFEGDTAAWMPTLLEAWTHESYAVRYEVLSLWQRMGPHATPAVEALLEGMKLSDERLATRAMYILGSTKAAADRVLPYLRNSLDELGDDSAAITIGRYGALGEPHLRSALKSPDDDVRYFALAGVYAMGRESRRLKDLVLPLVTVDDDDLAHRASMAMGAMGAEGAEALPAVWRRYVEGKMRHDQIAEILARIGPAGHVWLLARLADRKDAERARVALDQWPGDVRFAAAVIDRMLASTHPRDRVRGLTWLQRGITPPPAWRDTAWGDQTYRPADEVLDFVRHRAEPLAKDVDGNVRLQARTALDWIAEVTAGDEEGG